MLNLGDYTQQHSDRVITQINTWHYCVDRCTNLISTLFLRPNDVSRSDFIFTSELFLPRTVIAARRRSGAPSKVYQWLGPMCRHKVRRKHFANRPPVMNQRAKFEQNPTVHGWVILGVNLCKFLATFSQSWASRFIPNFRTSQGHHWIYTSLQKTSDMLLRFETTASQRPFLHFLTPV